MDYLSAIKSIESIFEVGNELNDNNCILVNGEWGIGKTYAIKEWIRRNESKYNVKYLSVFGKLTTRDIENDILIKLVGLLDCRESEAKRRGKKKSSILVRSVGDMALQALSNKTGIAFEAAEYVKSISVEELVDPKSKGKKTVICIDDLERKSNIEIIDLLGLIERATQNYNVIIIANTNQFSPQDKEMFEKYREKVIDYEFVIDKIDRDLQEKIVLSMFKEIQLGTAEINTIVENYNKPFRIDKNTALLKELHNIRVYKKYVMLIHKVLKEIKNVLKVKSFIINNEVVENCKATICMYYFANKYQKTDEKNQKNITLRDGELIEVFRQIFMGETYDKQRFKDIVSTDLEITEDIKRIYSAFKIRREEVSELFDKVQEKIKLKDLYYFASQHKIISLYDALISYGHLNDYKDQLIKIAGTLYKPSTARDIPRYDSNEWFDVGFWGGPIPCSRKTADFIKLINVKNQEIYRQHKLNTINKALLEGDVTATIKCISDISIVNEETFQKIFDLGWKNLDGVEHENGWNLLYKLIDRADSGLVTKFFECNDLKRFEDMQIRRFKHLEEVFEEKEYYREQAEEAARRQYEEQYEK